MRLVLQAANTIQRSYPVSIPPSNEYNNECGMQAFILMFYELTSGFLLAQPWILDLVMPSNVFWGWAGQFLSAVLKTLGGRCFSLGG